MNYNISAASFRGYGFLNKVIQNRGKSMEKLSSGYRINTASDDSAGSAMSSIMRAQIRGLEQATRNSDDGVELLNSAEGGLGQITSILQRIRELAVQSSNDTNTLDDRVSIQTEVDQLLVEIDRIAKTTEFNGVKLLNNEPDAGNLGKGLAALVGTANITPDGNLSDIYTTWQMLDPATGGANATDGIYRTKTDTFNEPISLVKVNGYNSFTLNGVSYSGDIFDINGTKLGNIPYNGASAILDPTASTLLPQSSVPVTPVPSKYLSSTQNSFTYTAPSTTPNSPYNKTYSPQNVATTAASSSAVYGKDGAGNLIQLSYVEYNQNIEEGTTYKVHSNIDEPLISASINFEKYNVPGGFTNADLYGTGFNSTCATCNQHYSIKFVQGSNSTIDKVPLTTQSSRYHYTIEMGIDSLSPSATGANLAEEILNTIKSFPEFAEHNTKYAVSGSTLYIFDYRTEQTRNPGRTDSFDAAPFEANIVKGSKENTAMKIQAGANAYEVVNIELPFISIKEMGINEIDLRDGVSANNAIPLLDSAIQFISIERAKIGTQRIRLEHASNIDQTASLATTESESKIHDVDFTSEMLNLTKLQMLEEYGVNSVVEINKMIENVIEFIK